MDNSRAPLLASHDHVSLAEHLTRAGDGAPLTTARAAAAKALRLAFGRDAGAASSGTTWTREALREAGIGAWAFDALLAFAVAPSLRIAEDAPAEDGTVRLALETRDAKLIETVLIPGPDRTTVCISSQVGCARACAFCETGRHGLDRQLASGEIVDQVRVAIDRWTARRSAGSDGSTGPDAPPVSNVVVMGMGEPFDNLAEVARAVRLLTDPRAFGLAPSRVTVSTVGVAEKLPAFFATCPAALAVSLNAPDDARRDRIMPVNRRTNLAALRAALVASVPAGKRVLFEYVLFGGFNDAPADADLVAAFVSAIPARVNVIPANPGPDPALHAPTPEALQAFVARLTALGVTTLVRRPRGRDVGGACGQLAGALRTRPDLVTRTSLRRAASPRT